VIDVWLQRLHRKATVFSPLGKRRLVGTVDAVAKDELDRVQSLIDPASSSSVRDIVRVSRRR
jgi:hypothetical protein